MKGALNRVVQCVLIMYTGCPGMHVGYISTLFRILTTNVISIDIYLEVFPTFHTYWMIGRSVKA